MSAPTGPLTAPAINRRRPRIEPGGIAVLEAFLKETGELHPSREERHALLEKINAIPEPGCQRFDYAGITSWFNRRRQAKERPRKSSQPDLSQLTSSTFYPSLSKDSIKYLTTLTQSQPSPSREIIQTWAELLHAGVEDVRAWVDERQRIVTEHPRLNTANHLPTPVSTSPEPRSEYQRDYPCKTDPLCSPVIPDTPTTKFPPSPVYAATREFEFSTLDLIEAVAEAAKTYREPASFPTTTQEFEDMFSHYEDRMQYIIHKNEEWINLHRLSAST